MNLIEIDRITFSYSEDDEPVFKGLSFSLNSGECMIIKGENGAGKSTLCRILNGLSFPDSGSYRFNGIAIDKKYLKNTRNLKLFHKNMGFLFQNPDVMLFNSSVYNEIAFGPRQMGFDDIQIDRRVSDCMKMFDIENLADKAPYHLSSGQKKRVAFASIVSLNPEILVLDEPLSGLDSKNRSLIISFLKGWKVSGKSLVIATHDRELEKTLGDKILEL